MRTRPTLLIALAVAGCTQTREEQPTAKLNGSHVSYPESYHADGDQPPATTAKAHYAAGQLAESMGRLDKAVTQYRDTIRLDPTHADALYHLGMILTAQRTADAPAVWQQYVGVTGGTAGAYSNLGFALDLAGRPAEAADAFRAGIAKDPACEACRVNYARLLARRGDLDAAAAQLSAVLTPAEVQFDLGAVLEAQGDRPGATARYRRALELDPKLVDATARLAAVN